jgi:FkbM family methyltransferase
MSIAIYKEGVWHTFPYNPWVIQEFPHWEKEKFKVFRDVKTEFGSGIDVLDIGAWIGTTTIWLSKNFNSVISVEADRKSLVALKGAISLSNCTNVTVCDRPIFSVTKDVIFGPPRESELNISISKIKSPSETRSKYDYTVKSITLKQLLFDYTKENSCSVGFIKCDIEGAEEDIIEDLLQYCFFNNVPLYLSFHVPFWKDKNYQRFFPVLGYFETHDSGDKGLTVLGKEDFPSLLLKRKPLLSKTLPIFSKSNHTVLIIAYNLVTYVKMMVDQIKKYTNDIVILDNASTFPPLLEYYETFEGSLIRLKTNFGHKIYRESMIYKLIGKQFFLTDPDIKFNPDLPQNFMEEIMIISRTSNANKVGFALDISGNSYIFREFIIEGLPFREFEGSKWWRYRIPHPYLELYNAELDTTFCFVNTEGINFGIRIARNYIAKHLPWYKGYEKEFLQGELEAYKNGNVSSCYLNSKTD